MADESHGPNFAALQQQMDTHPTLDQCRRAGQTHRAYGWVKTYPIGARNAEQRAAYDEGYNTDNSPR